MRIIRSQIHDNNLPATKTLARPIFFSNTFMLFVEASLKEHDTDLT